jgi:hypothetical protein
MQLWSLGSDVTRPRALLLIRTESDDGAILTA